MKQKITLLLEHLQFIFRPSFWIMLGKYDREWDKKLQQLAKEHDFVPINAINGKAAYCMLGDYFMWLGNYPYSFLVEEKVSQLLKFGESFSVYFFEQRNANSQPRPSRLTIMKLREKIIHDFTKCGVTLKDK